MGEPDPSQCHELAQSSLVFADSLVCEYLLFRGYVKVRGRSRAATAPCPHISGIAVRNLKKTFIFEGNGRR